nr:metal-dependent hydrolase [uncultured Chryseobacterium sp.]
MFIGHFGLSFAAKKAAPKVSLGMLFIATQFADILWPFMLIFNIEKVAIVPGYTEMNAFDFLYYPYTHSLLMSIVWGILAGSIYGVFKRDRRGAIVVALCVISHWFLDVIVHVADLPLSPFDQHKFGLGLWNHLILTWSIETIIFLTGVYIYATFTKPKNKIGKWGFWTLVTLLLVFAIVNACSPPPTSITSLFVSFIILIVLIVSLAYWVDKNREQSS